MQKPTLYVFVGMPGSGKSHTIDRPGSFFSGVVVGTDRVLDRYAAQEGITYNEAFANYIKDAEQEMYDEVATAVAAGQNIIWDQTNLTAKKRKHILSVVGDGYTKVAVVVHTGPNLALWHHRLDERSKAGKHIPSRVLDNMLASFTLPTLEEGFDQVVEL